MATIARLKKGTLILKNEINERLPKIKNGLIYNFPLDGRSGTVSTFGNKVTQMVQHTESGVNLIEVMDMDGREPSSWSGGGSMAGDASKDAMKVTNYSNAGLKTPIIVDTNKSYRISVDVFQEVAPSTGLYLGGYATNEVDERVTTNYDYSFAANANPSNIFPLGKGVTFRVTRSGTGSVTSNNSLSFDKVVGGSGTRTGLLGSQITKYYYFGGLFNYSSGGVLYFKNPKIEVYNNDNSEAIITDDGIVIENAVTNLVSNPTIFSSGWGKYSNGGYNNVFTTEFGTEAINLVNKQSGCGATKAISLPSAGTYTLSVWVKLINRTANNINVTLYTSGGGIGDTNVTASGDSDKIGKGQRISMTRTYTTTSFTLYLIAYGGTNAPGWEVSAQYTMPQVEAGTKANHFVDGSHGAATVGFKPDLTPTTTVVFDYYYTGSVSDTVISNANFNYGGGIFHNGTGNIYMHNGSNGASSSPDNFKQTPNTGAQLAISGDDTTQKMYANGNLLSSMTTTGSTNSANIPIMYLGWGWNRGNAKFKNLRVYNRQLSDEEVYNLSNNVNGLSLNGMLNDIVEKPLNIGEAYYFPLAEDNKILNADIGGSSDEGIEYGERCAYSKNGAAKLHFNLNSTIGLEGNKDFSIIYGRKPVTTTSYSIDSFGCNSNSVGGGYVWFGKNSGQNLLSGSTPAALTPAKYFDNGHMISIIRSGTVVTITTGGDIGSGDVVSPAKSIRTYTGPSTANAYVTQYDYDMKLGGGDNGSGTGTYLRDLIVIKRALSNTEIENIYKIEMSLFKEYAQIQHELVEEGI